MHAQLCSDIEKHFRKSMKMEVNLQLVKIQVHEVIHAV